MDEHTKSVMQACSHGSINGSMDFPEVVRALMAIGCEQYHADFRRKEKTYYMADGDSLVFPLDVAPEPVAQIFSPHGVVAALRAIQAGQISYVDFLRRIVDAGCVGYFVNLAGKRAIYLGRTGDSYVEYFPPPARA
jgi:uncharacterized protein YbcV (DUF1398 family)